MFSKDGWLAVNHGQCYPFFLVQDQGKLRVLNCTISENNLYLCPGKETETFINISMNIIPRVGVELKHAANKKIMHFATERELSSLYIGR